MFLGHTPIFPLRTMGAHGLVKSRPGRHHPLTSCRTHTTSQGRLQGAGKTNKEDEDRWLSDSLAGRRQGR